MSDGYFTVAEAKENLIVIERSKFICNIRPVANEEEAKAFIEEIRKKHSLANHNCYAYIADDKGLVQKFSDDGEPQGTAGLPMLNVLKNKRMYKTAVVVTRYFGGIKLGTGGLTRAYGGSVSECLAITKVANMQKAVKLELTADYDLYSKLVKFLVGDNLRVLNTDFADNVKVLIVIKADLAESFSEKIIDLFNGRLVPVQVEELSYAF